MSADLTELLGDSILEPSLLQFILFALPGFVSMRVYALLEPSDKTLLKDNLLEAVVFGVINVALLWPAFRLLLSAQPIHPLAEYTLVIVVLFVGPAIWPFAVQRLARVLSNRGLILRQTKTAWDAFFRQRQECWVIINLKNGDKIGGYFGPSSFATLHPTSGHLYVEELWRINDQGEFDGPVAGTMGAVFRPEDYDYIEMIGADDEGHAEGREHEEN